LRAGRIANLLVFPSVSLIAFLSLSTGTGQPSPRCLQTGSVEPEGAKSSRTMSARSLSCTSLSRETQVVRPQPVSGSRNKSESCSPVLRKDTTCPSHPGSIRTQSQANADDEKGYSKIHRFDHVWSENASTNEFNELPLLK